MSENTHSIRRYRGDASNRSEQLESRPEKQTDACRWDASTIRDVRQKKTGVFGEEKIGWAEDLRKTTSILDRRTNASRGHGAGEHNARRQSSHQA